MKKLLFFALCFGLHAGLILAQLPAFPGAEGLGKFASGARTSSTPTVYRVTNLNDSGTGSLRDAVSASNRIVVFDVAGVIRINSRVVVASNIYIAGQTAPGEGITVYGNGFSFSGANNTICRYIRIRMGAVGDSGKDALGISNGQNMIFDHVSVSWGRDETFSISWDGKGTEPTNITIQNSIMSQGLLSHSAGGLIQTNGGVTLYRNLYVDNDTRNNKIKGVNQYVNNVVYNWNSGAYIMGGDSEGHSYANAISNYFINGPGGSGNAFTGANEKYHLYAADNWQDRNRDGQLNGYLIPNNEYSGGPDFQTTPYNYPALPVWPASALVDSLLPDVGASLPYRDYVDYYVINEVKSFGKKGKFITNENELPFGVPSDWSLWAGVKRTDTDGDGIPDAWETANGLNPNLASDAVQKAGNGYLNIENYIHSITGDYSQPYLRAPMNLITDATTQNSVSVSWFDYTEKETGYIVERFVGSAFTETGRTGIDQNSFTMTGLQPEEQVRLRVRAYNNSGFSGYSNELTVKAKPVPVSVLDLNTFVPDLIWTGATSSDWNAETLNWNGNNTPANFSSNSKVLFADAANTNITLNETVTTSAVVVDSQNDYSISGTGSITGTGSMNKTGSGTLKLLTNNSYSGGTVLWNGVLEANKLALGGQPSSIGASQNYDFNLVFKGGALNYSGGNVTTDRNAVLDADAVIGVSNSATTVTWNGILNGPGGLNKTGAGKLLFRSTNSYEGVTTIDGGTLELSGIDVINAGLGKSNTLVLNGGTFRTTGGNTADYENYNMPIHVTEGKTSGFEPFRNCYIKSKVSGAGTLDFNITYVREYLQGDWSQFSGILNAKGIGTTTDGNQLMLNNNNGIPNGRVFLSGNTKVVCWKNASTMYLGGLSGNTGTYLSGSDKQNNAATMTWIVGGAGTDEIFHGIINNECSNKSYNGTTTIIKEGEGYWRLTGANIYKGTTTVRGGMLVVNGKHTGTGKVTVMNEATLAGIGTLPSVVEIQSGATLHVGDPTVSSNNVGTMTVGSLVLMSGSQLNMELMRTTVIINDRLAATGTVTLNGTLNLAIKGTVALAEGDQFTLFSGSSVSGKFEEIMPATPGPGLAWEMTGGVLKVIKDISAVSTAKEAGFSFGPNPINERLLIQTPDNYSKLIISLINASGNQVLNETASGNAPISLNTSALAAGIYFLRIDADEKLVSMDKVIKLP